MKLQCNDVLESKYSVGDVLYLVDSFIAIYCILGINFNYAIGRKSVYEEPSPGELIKVDYYIVDNFGSARWITERNLDKLHVYTSKKEAIEHYAKYIQKEISETLS